MLHRYSSILGKGRLTYDTDPPHYYDGDWVRGKRHGKGVYLNIDGCKYDGQWESDKISGSGISWYPNGNRYEGQWKDGKIHGTGKS